VLFHIVFREFALDAALFDLGLDSAKDKVAVVFGGTSGVDLAVDGGEHVNISDSDGCEDCYCAFG
jgi:hypothetical protein